MHIIVYHIVPIYIVHSLELICIINVVNITVQPMNDTVCLTQSTTASFTCVIDRGSLPLTIAGWRILIRGFYISVHGRRRHMFNSVINNDIITDTLTVTDVSVNDNGAQYRCEPDIGNVTSITVTLTVLGETITWISMYIVNVFMYTYICIINFNSMNLYSIIMSYTICTYIHT